MLDSPMRWAIVKLLGVPHTKIYIHPDLLMELTRLFLVEQHLHAL